MIQTMQHLHTFCSCALMLMAVSVWAQQPMPGMPGAPGGGDSGQVVLKVNGEPVTQGEINQVTRVLMQRQLQQMSGQGRQVDADALSQARQAVEEDARDQVINVTLMNQQIQKHIDEVDPAKIEEQIAQIRESLNEQGQSLETLIEQNPNYTMDQLRERISYQLAMRKAVEAHQGEIEVTEEEMKTYFENHKGEMGRPAEVSARHILLKTPEEASAEQEDEVRGKAQQLAEEARGGGDFAELAKEHSEGPSSSRGGELGFFQRHGQMVEPFAEAAWALEVGEVSDPVKTGFGYHVIKLTGRREAEEADFEELKAQIRMDLEQQQLDQKVEQMLEQLRTDADIVEVDE